MKNSVEIERKYVVKIPDISALLEFNGYTETEIVQIYLTASAGRTHRIRKRSDGTVTKYTETQKVRIDEISAFERECEIDAERFFLLSQKIRKGSSPIRKKRITFMWSDRLFELDIYPSWVKTCILEVELPTRDTVVDFPPFIELVKEVTGEKRYSNSSMANDFPSELI